MLGAKTKRRRWRRSTFHFISPVRSVRRSPRVGISAPPSILLDTPSVQIFFRPSSEFAPFPFKIELASGFASSARHCEGTWWSRRSPLLLNGWCKEPFIPFAKFGSSRESEREREREIRGHNFFFSKFEARVLYQRWFSFSSSSLVPTFLLLLLHPNNQKKEAELPSFPFLFLSLLTESPEQKHRPYDPSEAEQLVLLSHM